MTTLREGLPELPKHMRALPLDDRGYPVPWFVAIVNGKPDFRIIDAAKLPIAIRQRRCWICGETMGKFMTFLIGPMCTITRTIAEPPAHLDCALFSARACPFLSLPKATRRDRNLPEGTVEPAGIGLKRNPGVVVAWVTRTYRLFGDGRGGTLFSIGPPLELHWFAEGRTATRAEILESINSGLPKLQELAEQDGPPALTELEAYVARALKLVPVDLA